MAIPLGTFVVTDEGGAVTRHPWLKSTTMQFEARYKNRKLGDQPATDQAIMAYRAVHGTWPASPAEVEAWYDSVDVEFEAYEGNGAEPGPTNGAPEPTF